MKRLMLLAYPLWILSCGGGLSLSGASSDQPRVVGVTPTDGGEASGLDKVTVTFSEKIDITTISQNSFLVLEASPEVTEMTTEALDDVIDDGDFVSLAGHYRVESDGVSVSWVPDVDLAGGSYAVIVTSRVRNRAAYPLNQTPGEDITYFTSSFDLTDTEGGESSGSSEDVTARVSLSAPEVLLINEVYYDDPTSDTDGFLFIELYGTPHASLNGYRILFINGANGEVIDELSLDATAVLSPEGLCVVADHVTGDSSSTRVEAADVIANFDPQNGPDSVVLLAPDGTLADTLGYGEFSDIVTSSDGFNLFESESTPRASAGHSLSRVNATDTDNNDSDFVVNIRPSPGSFEVTLEPSEGEGGGSEEQSETESAGNEPIDLARVMFTEVVTDPQQDWNDTTGGNAIPFDATVGSGTVGPTDEWIEIHNGTDEPVDLTGWRLEMLDGTDEIDSFSSSTYLFSEGGSFSSFLPDEFLIVGNPPGDLKNAVTLRLIDNNETVMDELDVMDADATGVSDESFQVLEAEWGMGEATIGF